MNIQLGAGQRSDLRVGHTWPAIDAWGTTYLSIVQQTQARVIVNGETIEEIESFEITDDVMAVGEEQRFTVVAPRKYRDKLRLGDSVELIMQHPDVNGGTPTTKHRGKVIRREASVSPTGGCVINVTTADPGWHLQNSDAPIHIRLQGKTYAQLVDPATSPLFGKSWGFKGLRFGANAALLRRSLKLGVAAAAIASQQVLDPVHVIQVEPGQKPWDLIVEYCRRLNLLVNVSPDGYLNVYRPVVGGKAAYSLRCVDGDAGNNVLSASVAEDARTRYTEVTVVGEQFGYEGSQDPNDPNASKKVGRVYHKDALPFDHRLCAADGEMFANSLAQKQAEWLYRRNLYDSLAITVEVAEHHQGGLWWAADSVVNVQIDDLGLSGNFYLQSCRCTSSKTDGDKTTLTLRMPDLLSAAFGELPNPPIYRAYSVGGGPSK